MIAITTRSSTSVKPLAERMRKAAMSMLHDATNSQDAERTRGMIEDIY
jgi:hypothetical protein